MSTVTLYQNHGAYLAKECYFDKMKVIVIY